MKDVSRREFIGTGLAVAGASALSSYSPFALAQTPTLSYKPEPGAKLRVLRWKRFVQGDEDQFMINIAFYLLPPPRRSAAMGLGRFNAGLGLDLGGRGGTS